MKYTDLTKKQKEEYKLIIESESFDDNYYRLKYKIHKDHDSIVHYLRIGFIKGYNPSPPNFDTKFYLKTYPDVKKAKINPFIHYLKYGKKGHRIPKGLTQKETKKLKLSQKNIMDYLTIQTYDEFDKEYYLKNYNLKNYKDPIAHYLEIGVYTKLRHKILPKNISRREKSKNQPIHPLLKIWKKRKSYSKKNIIK